MHTLRQVILLAVIALAFSGGLAVLASGCQRQTIEGRPDARNSAVEAYWMLRDAVEHDRPNAAYYLLDASVRDRAPYHVFMAAWPQIQEQCRALVLGSGDDAPEPSAQFAADPRNGQHGSFVVLPLGDPAAPEQTLWARVRDHTRWPGEIKPRWRLVYPLFLDGYQARDDHALMALPIDWGELATTQGAGGNSDTAGTADNGDATGDEADTTVDEADTTDGPIELPPGFD